MEKDMRDPEELPVTIKDYLENGPFEVRIDSISAYSLVLTVLQLQDTPGQEEVVLTRKFGDERYIHRIQRMIESNENVMHSIRITFSIADLNTLDQDPDQYSEDRALYDEDNADMPTDTQSGGAQSKGTINQGRTKGGNVNVAPEDSIAPADRPELADDESPESEDGDQEPSFPARVNVTIEKAGKGAVQIETVAQDGMISIDNVYYFPDGELADAKTAEKDWARRGLYTGPPFGNLDEDLQVLLERYLDERGVNTALALFVPDYIDFKEQREYLAWLSSELFSILSSLDAPAFTDSIADVKSFIEA